jgi:hypothetical protein
MFFMVSSENPKIGRKTENWPKTQKSAENSKNWPKSENRPKTQNTPENP